MKYIKTFEKRQTPKIGDYIIADSTNFTWAKNMVKTTVGRINSINYDDNHEIYYSATYGKDGQYNGIHVDKDEIIEFSPNKKKLEEMLSIILSQNKFNL